MARLQESKEALQEAEMSIRDGIAQIGDELENTFDLVDEKLDQQFTKFDQLIELMDHYKNVVSLTEGEASYKEFNKILKASQEVIRDRIAADESEVAMWESRRKQLEDDIATLPEDSPAKREAEEAL
jgi:predicted  nucleic acid-binding Zn-ribbon protein